jgi:PilZ domain
MSKENRTHPRNNIGRPVYIIKAPIRCEMSDISRSGARLSVDDADALPDQFMLYISEKLSRWCRIVWRDQNQVGIEYIASPQELSSSKITAAVSRLNEPVQGTRQNQ